MMLGPLLQRTRAAVALVLGVAIASACSDTAPTQVTYGYGVVRISPTMLSYGAGGRVRLEVENVGPSAIFAGICPDALERQAGNRWEADQSFDNVCEAVLLMIQPGVIGPGTVNLPELLRTGMYRARYDHISAVNGSKNELIGVRYSEPFAVTAAAAR